jgi:alkyl sulfatase BDS1-like metallo-beta-lactamase superfamily hydrolase
MKLVRFGEPGQEKPGLVDDSGTIRDLSAHIPDIDGRTLGAQTIAKLKALDAVSLPAAPDGVRIGAPVGDVRNYMAIGLNGPEAAQHEYTFNMIFPDINEEYLLSVENGVLIYTEDKMSVTPNTTIIINRRDLDDVILGEKEICTGGTTTDCAPFSYGGNIQDFRDFLALLKDEMGEDEMEESLQFWFNIVLP